VSLLRDCPTVAKPKRNDEVAKIDSEVLRIARAVAALRGITLAEYLSERLRPLVLSDHAEEVRTVQDQYGGREPRRRKGDG
jgi:hypothetical protein